MEFVEIAKLGATGGATGLALGLIYVVWKIVEGSSKERIEAQKLMAAAIDHLANATEANTKITSSLDQYIRLRNGAMEHALDRLGITVDVPRR